MPKIRDEYDVGAAFAAIENELMSSMVRNMERHKVEEIGEEKEWEMWQALQLKSLDKYKRQNKEKYGTQFQDINKRIGNILIQMNEDGQMDQERKILKAIKNGADLTKASDVMSGRFFEINDRKMDALIKATTGEIRKAETAVLRKADDVYRKTIFNAQVYANSGAGTYEKAVDMATKDFISAGLNCVEYKNGARHTLSDYADMAVRTAAKRAYLQGEGTKRQEWGIHTVIVNQRSDTGPGGVCPECLPFVGKVFIDDVWSGGKEGEKDEDGEELPLLSDAIGAGLYHPRCRDSHTTYFPGISTPPSGKITKKDVQEAVETEKEEARQQYAERQAEKYERLAETRLDPENKQQYEARADRWGAEADRLRNRANLSADPFERMFLERQAGKMEDVAGNRMLQKMFRGARFKEQIRTKRFEDITDRWFPDEIPGSHKVERLPKLFIDGVEHIIDGHHIKFDYDKHELEIAKMLARDVGGQVYMRPKINFPLGQPSADYEFNGFLYDLKTLRPNARNNTIYNRVKKCEGQANRFIIDVSKTELTDEIVENQISKIFWSKDTKFIDEIVIVKDYQVHRVAHRK